MNLNTVSSVDFGRSLKGLGINLLTRDVLSLTSFLSSVFKMQVYRESSDFAILKYHDEVLQIHADSTYHSHPLPSLLPEAGPRGGGIEMRLYETDPDSAIERAGKHGHPSVVLQAATNKPHGLRESVILCESGYAWIPSRRLTDEEAARLD